MPSAEQPIYFASLALPCWLHVTGCCFMMDHTTYVRLNDLLNNFEAALVGCKFGSQCPSCGRKARTLEYTTVMHLYPPAPIFLLSGPCLSGLLASGL